MDDLRITKLTQRNAPKLLARWFDAATLRSAYTQLAERVKHLQEGSALQRDAMRALGDHAMLYVNNLKYRLQEIEKRSPQGAPVYYVAYVEHSLALHQFILYSWSADQDPQLLQVKTMAICYGGVWEDVRQDVHTRPPMHELFQWSLCTLKERHPSIESIRIHLFTRGSETVVKHTFRLQDLQVEDGAQNIEIPEDLCCQVCCEAPAAFSLERVGGAFCSQRCAQIQWALWRELL